MANCKNVTPEVTSRPTKMIPRPRRSIPLHARQFSHRRKASSRRAGLPQPLRTSASLSYRNLQNPLTSRGASIRSFRNSYRQPASHYGVFIDNNLGSKPEYLPERSLPRGCGAVKKSGAPRSTIDVYRRIPQLIREMALAGCTGVFIGFESLTNDNLTDCHKKTTQRPGRLPSGRVEIFHRNGIQVNGSFVLGFDHDGPDIFERTVQGDREKRNSNARTFHILHAFIPARHCSSRLEKDGRRLHQNWDLYDNRSRRLQAEAP